MVGMASLGMIPIREDPLESSYEEGMFYLEEEDNPEHFGESGWGSAWSLARTENSSDLATMAVASTESLGEPEALLFSTHGMDYNDHQDYIWMGGAGKLSMH